MTRANSARHGFNRRVGKIAEKLYAAAADQSGEDVASGAGQDNAKADEDVVDAEFEEVKDDEKK